MTTVTLQAAWASYCTVVVVSVTYDRNSMMIGDLGFQQTILWLVLKARFISLWWFNCIRQMICSLCSQLNVNVDLCTSAYSPYTRISFSLRLRLYAYGYVCKQFLCILASVSVCIFSHMGPCVRVDAWMPLACVFVCIYGKGKSEELWSFRRIPKTHLMLLYHQEQILSLKIRRKGLW